MVSEINVIKRELRDRVMSGSLVSVFVVLVVFVFMMLMLVGFVQKMLTQMLESFA